MNSSSKQSTSSSNIVSGSSSDSQDEGNYSSSWLDRFQRVSEEEALRMALEESVYIPHLFYNEIPHVGQKKLLRD